MTCLSVAPSRNSIAMNAAPIDFANIVNRANVWMVEGGGGLGFTAEPLETLSVAGEVVGQKFESDESVQASVFGLINDAHATTTELIDDAVMGDGLADHGRDF